MSAEWWPDLPSYPGTEGPVPTVRGTFGFTGGTQTFTIPSYTPGVGMTGAVRFWMRGGRGEGVEADRFNMLVEMTITDPAPGTYTVVVGGDAVGTTGGYGGGGDGSSATSGLYTDGGGGGGATYILDPEGVVVACAGGTGGACGGTVFMGRMVTEPPLYIPTLAIGVAAEFPANWSEYWPLPQIDGYSRHSRFSYHHGVRGFKQKYSNGEYSYPPIDGYWQADHLFSRGADGGPGGNSPTSSWGDQSNEPASLIGARMQTGDSCGYVWDETILVPIEFPPELGWPTQYLHGDYVEMIGGGGACGYTGTSLQGGVGATSPEGPGAGGGGGGVIGGGGGGNVDWQAPVFRDSILDVHDPNFVLNPDGSIYFDGAGHPVIHRQVDHLGYIEYWGIGPGGHGSWLGHNAAAYYYDGWTDPSDTPYYTDNEANGQVMAAFYTWPIDVPPTVGNWNVGSVGSGRLA